MTFVDEFDEHFVKDVIDIPVDYTQWQRETKKKNQQPDEKRSVKKVTSIYEKRISPCPKVRTTLESLQSSHSSPGTIYKRPSTESPPSDFRRECSSRCRHGNSFVTNTSIIKPQETVRTYLKKTKDGVISLLKIQIKEKRVSLRESKQRYLQLVRDNVRLKDDITSYEQETHNDVKHLLESYRKYRGGFSVLASQHTEDLKKQEANLREVRERCETAIKVLEEEVRKLDGLIADEKHSLKVLLNYKEKEYPDNMEQIKHLKEEISYLEEDFEENLSHLARIAAVEEKDFKEHAANRIKNVTAIFAENAISDLDGSVRSMARRNVTMKTEVEWQKAEEMKHRQEISLLNREIRQLKKMEEQRLAHNKHPELFMENFIDQLGAEDKNQKTMAAEKEEKCKNMSSRN